MGDWPDKGLKRLSDERLERQTRDSAFLERQRVKRELGMPLWLEIRETITKNCDDFNTKARKQILVFEVSINTELSVHATIDGVGHYLHASYEESIGKLTWSSGKSHGNWAIEPTDDGKAEFVGSRGSMTVEWIVDEMLTALI
jgi:hypothetical protein